MVPEKPESFSETFWTPPDKKVKSNQPKQQQQRTFNTTVEKNSNAKQQTKKWKWNNGKQQWTYGELGKKAMERGENKQHLEDWKLQKAKSNNQTNKNKNVQTDKKGCKNKKQHQNDSPDDQNRLEQVFGGRKKNKKNNQPRPEKESALKKD